MMLKLGRLPAAILLALKMPAVTLALSMTLNMSAPDIVVGQEPNNGYPVEVVPLPTGMLLCRRLEDVERTFENWKYSFEHRLPEKLAEGCERNLSENIWARLEFLSLFQNEHLSADMLKLYLFSRPAEGMLVLEKIAFGYGDAKIKPGVFARQPKPTPTSYSRTWQSVW